MSTSSPAYCRKAWWASSITTTSSTPSGKPSASRRPVVICTGRPTRFSPVRCRATSAETLLMPGTTSYAKSTEPLARTSWRTASVLSYSAGSPHTRNAPRSSSPSSSAISRS